MQATFVKDTPAFKPGQTGKIFKLDQTLESEGVTFDHIWISGILSAVDTHRPETFIFPCDENGDVLDWGELPGSIRDVQDIDLALNRFLEAHA